MALFLSEDDVAKLLPMNECINVLEEAFLHSSNGKTDIQPRSRIRMPNGFFHFMAAADADHGVFGYKAYPSFTGTGGSKFLVMLYDYESGELLACLESGRLGQIRTGAASGLATKYMAKGNVGTVGVIGSGFQARSQLEAICAVRDINQVKIFSRREDRRNDFAGRMSERLQVDIIPVATSEECVSDSDIIVTITSSRDPVFNGDALKNGSHVNAAGSNHWMRAEIDEKTVTRSSLIVVDDLEQAKAECGDLLLAEARGTFRWDMARELRDVIGGRVSPPYTDEGITLFESMGVALEDIAAAQLVYHKAVDQGIGAQLPF